GDHPVFADVQPGSDFLGKFFTVETAWARGCFLHGGGVFHYRKNRESRPENLEEIAPAQRKLVHWQGAKFVALRLQARHRYRRGVFHLARSCMFPAAFWIASMILGYVPHRQIFPCIACAICSGEGCKLARSRDTPLKIIPVVQ